MSTPAASIQSQLPEQENDEVFAHILKHKRALITVGEVAALLTVSKHFIYNLCDEGHLEEHNLRGPRRVTRRSLVKFLLNTANYKPQDARTYIEVLMLLVEDLNLSGLDALAVTVEQLRAKRTPAGHTPQLFL